MKSARTVTVLLALALTSTLVLTGNQPACASDLATRANIFMYPKPMSVSRFALQSLSGQPVSLGDYRGRVVLLRFSSINCPACRMEEPSLVELKNRFGQAGLEILTVNLVDSLPEVAQHAAASKEPFPTLVGGGGLSLRVVDMAGKKTAFVLNPAQEAIFEVPGFPTTYIFDCSGSAVGYSVGAAQWNDAAATDLIHRLVTDARLCAPPRQAQGGPKAFSRQ
jgi:thiol-disulfide isomerase/thioredoxin